MKKTEGTETPTPRKSAKGTFVIQQKDTVGAGPGWADIAINAEWTAKQPLDSTAAAKKYIRDNGLEGTFRIICVKATVKTKTVPMTKVVFE